MHEPLEVSAWRFAVGDLATEHLPDIATHALLIGHDSPALRELAGMSNHEVREAADLFHTCLTELGIGVFDEQEALWKLVGWTADQIISGAIPAYQGARWIWRNAAYRVEQGDDLGIFIGLASEWEDNPEARAELEPQIVTAAKEFLAHP